MNKRRIAGFLSALLLLSLVLTACNQKAVDHPTPTEPPSTETATTEQHGKSIRPQDDFFESVNGSYLLQTDTMNEPPQEDLFEKIATQVENNLKTIGEEVAKNQEKHAEGSNEQVVAAWMRLANDAEGREKAGLGKLQPYLDRIRGASTVDEVVNAMASIRKELGKNGLLSLERSPDPKGADRYALFIDDPAMLLKKEDMQSPEAVSAMKTYIAELLTANGTEPKVVQEESEKLAKFYQELADIALSKADRDDPKRAENTLSLDEIQAKMPNLRIDSFLKATGQEGFANHVVNNPDMLEKVNRFLTPENLNVLKQYATVQLLHEYALLLNEDFQQAAAKFNQMDFHKETLAWEVVKQRAEAELGELYAKKTFTSKEKEGVESLVRDIMEAYKKKLQSADWLSEPSRQTAIRKLEAMRLKIAYPEPVAQENKAASVVPKEGGSLIDAAVATDLAKSQAEIEGNHKEVDRETWPLSPQTVNAYYDPALNEIVFPAAMLQAPFYDAKASYAQNLGSIGSIIAHEITHAFDDAGSLYDEKGNYRSWWNEADQKAFNERAKTFIEYFGSQEILPGHKVNGKMTLGENIADTGSLSVISSMLGDDKEALKELFTSYAKLWASQIGEEDLLDQLASDEHAPAKVRVNAVLSLTDAFYKAFDVKPGDRMYVAPESRAKLF